MDRLIDRLAKNKKLPMHMPGHKRNTAMAPYLKRLAADLDITEIDGFDNLHRAEGILKNSMEKCAEMRGAKRAFYLVNGSTCGILSAVYAAVSEGDKVICARNCHKSVYNALELAGADVRFILPEPELKTGGFGEITNQSVKNALIGNKDAKLLIITSPTYEGIVSDIKSICNEAHKYSIPVLVDAAHGAHFGFGYGFPESATACGADISVESLHKTLPSLTQTAVCYLSGNLIDYERIADCLAVFETSSPSYLLLASIDSCIDLLRNSKDKLFGKWQENLDYFYKDVSTLKNLEILSKDVFFDRSKIVICGSSGKKITEMLRKNGIEPEMTSLYYTVAMTGAGDTKKSLKYLSDALTSIDCFYYKTEKSMIYPEIPERIYTPKEVKKLPCREIGIKNAAGCVSAEYIFAYPPGIPLVIPGEKISDELVNIFAEYEKKGVELLGNSAHNSGKILVINT